MNAFRLCFSFLFLPRLLRFPDLSPNSRPACRRGAAPSTGRPFRVPGSAGHSTTSLERQPAASKPGAVRVCLRAPAFEHAGMLAPRSQAATRSARGGGPHPCFPLLPCGGDPHAPLLPPEARCAGCYYSRSKVVGFAFPPDAPAPDMPTRGER